MLLVNENQPSKGAADVVSIDLARGIARRLTGGTSTNRNGIWSRDAQSIAFSSDRAGYYDVYVKAADPDASVRVAWKNDFDKHVTDWSPGPPLGSNWSKMRRRANGTSGCPCRAATR